MPWNLASGETNNVGVTYNSVSLTAHSPGSQIDVIGHNQMVIYLRFGCSICKSTGKASIKSGLFRLSWKGVFLHYFPHWLLMHAVKSHSQRFSTFSLTWVSGSLPLPIAPGLFPPPSPYPQGLILCLPTAVPTIVSKSSSESSSAWSSFSSVSTASTSYVSATLFKYDRRRNSFGIDRNWEERRTFPFRIQQKSYVPISRLPQRPDKLV